MKLSIIIPVFNEGKTIKKVLEKISELKLSGIEKEIIVIDDGSTDDSVEKIKEFVKKRQGVRFISKEKNEGKGAAVLAGIRKSTGSYILIQDADLEYHPDDIPDLLISLQNGAKVVYGTRLARLPNFAKDERTFRFFLHYLGNKGLSLATSLLYRQWITDMETGYKLFPKDAVDEIQLFAKSFDFEPEITAKLLKKGYKIVEVPISTNPRNYKEGKKLNTFRDGPVALWTLVKYRFVD